MLRLHEDKGLFLGGLAPGVEAIEIEDRIQNQRIRAAGFTAVNGVDGEKDHMTAARGNIEDGGVLSDFVAAIDQAGDEQI